MRDVVADEQRCSACPQPISKSSITLSRSAQRVRFVEPTLEIEEESCDVLAFYCSSSCMRSHLSAQLAAERVSVPNIPPIVGPVEICSVCKSLLDTTQFHVAYEVLEEEFGISVARTPECEWVARVCTGCVRRPYPNL